MGPIKHHSQNLERKRNFSLHCSPETKIDQATKGGGIRVRKFDTGFKAKYIHERQRSGRISAGYWGWISKDGPGELISVGGRLYSENFGGFKDMVFMQDNYSIHNAQICMKWFSKHPDLVRLEAPVNSPDLNPIENVWGEMVRDWVAIYPRNIDNLNAVVMRIWKELREKPDYFQSLYNSIQNRRNTVIDANGDHIDLLRIFPKLPKNFHVIIQQ
ncbi:Transposable element Tc3 transposase [Pseudolycoriella hygida]|uniref:Transposable element Tc3 transposase n=1 Tax=Pseudolycoriella hygida TaxID=35572 RepID=A0A9Q0N8Q8_9DIPT|nr:Transposable element Tc3 transposase [Pseudolycoriella hygida]